jgi:hypothetical protein
MPEIGFERKDNDAHGKETNAGIIISAGEIQQSDWDEKDFREKQQDYTYMRNGSGIIKGNLKASKLPLLNAGWHIEPGRKTDKAIEAAKYIEWQFKSLKKGYNYFRRHCLLALDYGCAFFEKIEKRGVKYNNGSSIKTTNIYTYFSPVQNDTLDKFRYDENGAFEGITHEKREPEQGQTFVDVDAKRLFWSTWDEEYDNVQGNSILRPIRDVWDLKKKVQRGLAITVQRMGGIPVGTAYGDLGNLKKGAEKTLRTVASSENTYVMEHKDKWEFRLEAVNGLGEGNQLLEFLTREMFFNMLNQFMIAGIGQNGSRAATGEHKTTFELFTINVLGWLEELMQMLTNEMMQIGYLQSIPVDDWPLFKFNNINQIDMLKAAQQITMLYEKGVLDKSPEDQKYFREFFGYPAKVETKVATGEEGEIEDKQQFSKCSCGKSLEKGERRELTKLEKEVFQLENATNTFLDVQEESERIIDSIIEKMLEDAAEQVRHNKDKDLTIRFGSELSTKLMKVYEKSYREGEKDITIELSKIDKGKKLELTPKKKLKVKKTISLRVDRLQNSIKTNLEIALAKAPISHIRKVGGTHGFIMNNYLDKFKTDRRNLITEVQSGYTNGRGDTLKIASTENSVFQYTAILDKNVCAVCAPLDGTLLTRNEIDASGLQFDSPVNPECLGKDQDRCQLIAVEI